MKACTCPLAKLLQIHRGSDVELEDDVGKESDEGMQLHVRSVYSLKTRIANLPWIVLT